MAYLHQTQCAQTFLPCTSPGEYMKSGLSLATSGSVRPDSVPAISQTPLAVSPSAATSITGVVVACRMSLPTGDGRSRWYRVTLSQVVYWPAFVYRARMPSVPSFTQSGMIRSSWKALCRYM